MSKSGSLYIEQDSLFHRLDGSVKFLLLIAWTIFTFMFMDARIFALMIFIGFMFVKMSKIPWKNIKPFIIFIIVFTIFNSIFFLVITPDYGSELSGKTTKLLSIGNYTITLQTIFYAFTLSLKYISMLPITLLFLFTTHPSKFASSLNRIGISYKVAYTVSIALRYIPDVKDEVTNIMNAQEARGVAFKKGDANIKTRIKNYTQVLLPLLMSSLSRIEVVSNAMELRGFGRNKKRSWYTRVPINYIDIMFIILSIMLIVIGYVLKHTSSAYFWCPF